MPSVKLPLTIPVRQSHSRLERLEVLYRISNLINTTQDRQKVLRAVLREVVRITNATSGSIAMLDERRGILNIETAINIPTRTWKKLKLQLGVGVTGWCAFKGKPQRVGNVKRDPRYIAVKGDVRSELAVPMILHKRIIGVINVDSNQVDAFTEDDERMLVAVADQAARVIETARLYEAVTRHAEHMESMFRLGQELTSHVPLEEILSRTTDEGRRLLSADVCAIVEVNHRNQTLSIRAATGVNGHWQAPPPVPIAESLLAPVVRDMEPLAISNVDAVAAPLLGTMLQAESLQSLLAVPVTFQGDLLAVLLVLSNHKRTFNEPEKKLLGLLANQGAVAIEIARRQERLYAMEDSMHRAERFSLLGTLAAEIAHEIRNPVTIINLLLHSVSEETRDNPQVSADLGIVRGKLDRIERIVDQTLNMARNREPRREKVSMNELVRDVTLFMNYKCQKTGIELKEQLDETLPDIDADRGQMQQVLLNLTMNAVEAMKDGDKLTIRTRRESDPELGPCLGISVQDTGCGIARDHVEQLFEPFFTMRAGGTGLGLFITRKIVTAHSGDIRVKSREGKGSTFTVLLPLEETNKAGSAPCNPSS